jgi:hypothetical protein
MRTAPPGTYKIWVMSTIPADDPDFVEWHETQEISLTVREAMERYMPYITKNSRAANDKEWEEH